MSELLELAEHYYFVARDLRAQAVKLNEMATYLEAVADRACEANIKRTAQAAVPETEG